MSGTEPDFVTTRGEAIPPDAPEPRRTRVARPTVDDLPRGQEREPPAEQDAAPDPAIAAMAARAKAAEDKAAALERERQEWQRERDALQSGKTEAESRGFSAQKMALQAEIAAEDQRIAAARQRFRAAREAGDIEAEDAANDDLAQARARKLLLDRDKQAWADWEAQQAAEAARAPKQPEPAARQPAAAPPQDGGGLSPSDVEWVQKHPEFSADPECEQWIRSAATRIMSEGVQRGSPRFYRDLSAQYDRYLRLRELDQAGGGDPAPAPRRAARQDDYEDEPPPRPAPRRQAQPSAASMAPSPSRGGREDGGRSRTVSPEAVARKMNVAVQDLRDFSRGRKGGFEGYVNEMAKELGMI